MGRSRYRRERSKEDRQKCIQESEEQGRWAEVDTGERGARKMGRRTYRRVRSKEDGQKCIQESEEQGR